MKKLVLIISFLFIALTQNAQTELWGTTSYGGQSNAGIIYKTDTAGNQIIEHNFFQIEGESPTYNYLTEVNNKLYGMTPYGGLYATGILFEYDPITNLYMKKIEIAGTDGNSPFGGLFLASDGKLYGMTYAGGVNGKGVIFQYDPTTNIYTKKYDFDGAVNGSYPYGSLIQASDGKLYGVTSSGGLNGAGVLFQYDPIGDVFIKKMDFDGVNFGSAPKGTLMQATNGMLYGLTYQGGVNNAGVLFQYDPLADIYMKKLDFDGVGNGANPHSTALIQATDGKLYGLTHFGGINSKGVLFQYDFLSNVYTKKIDFDGITNGSNPQGSLIQAADGNFYAVTKNGGLNNMGVLFQYNIGSSTYSKKIDFDATISGRNPSGTLIQTSNGNLYGMTFGGGPADRGTLFQYNTGSNIYTKKFEFFSSINGNVPFGPLTNSSLGKLYGAAAGGTDNCGVIFQYDPIMHLYSKVIDCNSLTNGCGPLNLISASDGKLYGVTFEGGINNSGILFQIDPTNNTFTKKIDFNGTTDGQHPSGSLMQASDGKLYGMTKDGGTNGFGTIFQYNPITNVFTKKIDFSSTIGKNSQGSLIEFSDGKFYGVTHSGSNSLGSLIQYDPITNICIKTIDFSGAANGSYPWSHLLYSSNGKLYGTTGQGGINDLGVLFEYDPANNLLVKKIDFIGPNGLGPFGPLYETSIGEIYGTTNGGGLYGCGILYKYNPVSNNLTTKINFNGSTGCISGFSNVIEISSTPTDIKQSSNQNNHNLYPNPNNGSFTIELNTKSNVLITNTLGEIIFNQSIEGGKQNLSIQSQAEGIYFIKVTDDKGVSVSKKIIKQ